MPVEIRMPELSATVTEADLIAWLVKPGDRVEAGDVIAEIETDKSTVELEAEVPGTVVELRVGEGTTGVPVGTVLAVLEPEASAGEARTRPGEVDAAARAAETPPAPETRESESRPRTAAAPPAPPRQEAARPTAPPATALARRIAQQSGVDLDSVEGSGSAGRITRADVERALAGRPEAPASEAMEASSEADGREAPFDLLPLTRMRRTIARRLGEAKQTVPHFYLRCECRVDALLSTRLRLNERGDGTRVSINDFVVRALALALVEVPEANVAWSEDGIRSFRRVDVSVAVATDGGLVTPVVRGAERKALRAISDEIRELAERAREGRLAPAEYEGGTFSVSNLGMYGVESVYPILNPPQAGIIGVGAVEERPVARDGRLEVGRVISCTLSADHRAVDGAIGARLLAAVKRRLEDPLSMLL